jgi:hypothetical protein
VRVRRIKRKHWVDSLDRKLRGKETIKLPAELACILNIRDKDKVHFEFSGKINQPDAYF